MKSTKSKTILLTWVAVVVLWFVACGTNAEACATGQPCKTGFGILGISRGETARAYGVNTGAENGVIAIIRYVDLAGNVLAESGEIRLGIGQGTFFDLDSSALNFTSQDRIPVRVEVSIWDPGTKKLRKVVGVSSVELFETSSGKTLQVVGLPFIEQKKGQ